jgi:D-alanyl-D-alanine carboxypeptidase
MGKAPDTHRFHAYRFRAVALAAAGLCALAIVGAHARTVGAGLAAAARQNRQGLSQLSFAPFRRPELGWAIYEPLVAHEIGAKSGAATLAFAGHLAVWQAARRLPPTGVMDEASFDTMVAAWQERRPFVAASRRGCPLPPSESSLALVPASQSYGGKTMLLRPAALAAYGRMLAAARAESPGLRDDPRLMTLFSAYRDVASDAARCARDGNCQGIVRAACSSHLTGLTIDLYLGAAPGYSPDSSDDVNRLYISRGPAYRWIVNNASRFGFTPYAFEPWHWEWIGEPV